MSHSLSGLPPVTATQPGPLAEPSVIFGTGLLHARARRWDFPRTRRPYALLDTALAHGTFAFDTARSYGGGWVEELLGAWIKTRRVRERVIIVTKGAHPDSAWRGRVTVADIRADFEASLRALAVDYIDVYMLHRDDPSQPFEPWLEALHGLVASGRVRALGASNWGHARIEAANRYAQSQGLTPFLVSSPHHSLAEMAAPLGPGCLSIAGPSQGAARAYYRETRMPVLAWSPLSGGVSAATREDPSIRAAFGSEPNAQRWRRASSLAAERGATPVQIALAYLLSQPFPVHAVVSASTPERLKELCEARRLRLSQDELSWIDEGTRTFAR